MRLSVSEEKIRYLNEHTDFAKTVFDGLLGYAVIASDFDGNIIAYNAGANLIYGYAPEVVIGHKSLDMIFPPDFKANGRMQEIMDNLLKKGSYSIASENVRKSGETFPANMVFTPVRSNEGRELGLVTIVQDLTEIRKAENEIRQLNQSLEQRVAERTAQFQESEARFRAVAESAGDAIICLKMPDTIYLWNKKAEEIFGYSAAEAIGAFLHDLIVPERYRRDAGKGLNDFFRSGAGPLLGRQVELSALRKDGAEFPVELSISAVKAGNEWHAIGIIRDITERKRTEEDLRKNIAELERFKKATVQREFRIKELKEKLEGWEKGEGEV